MSDILYSDVMVIGGTFLSLMDQAWYSAIIWTQLSHADSYWMKKYYQVTPGTSINGERIDWRAALQKGFGSAGCVPV